MDREEAIYVLGFKNANDRFFKSCNNYDNWNKVKKVLGIIEKTT